jgi:hypothetical protein
MIRFHRMAQACYKAQKKDPCWRRYIDVALHNIKERLNYGIDRIQYQG